MTMSKKKISLKKLRIDPDKLKRPFLLIAMTLAIVVIGLGIPMALLGLQTRQAALPKGNVAVDEIQPYGADIIEMESAVISSIRTASNIESADDWTYLDSILQDPPEGKKATLSNYYGELELKDRSRNDLTYEFYYEVYDLIADNFGGVLPEQVTISTIADPSDLSRNVVLVTDPANYNNYALLDPSTGIPIAMSVEVVNQSVPDLDLFWNDLFNLYSDYLGIALFANDQTYRNYEWSGDYDSWYSNEVMTSDEKLDLFVYISSGWYWTEPEYDGDDWHPTDSYIWTIAFELYEN